MKTQNGLIYEEKILISIFLKRKSSLCKIYELLINQFIFVEFFIFLNFESINYIHHPKFFNLKKITDGLKTFFFFLEVTLMKFSGGGL